MVGGGAELIMTRLATAIGAMYGPRLFTSRVIHRLRGSQFVFTTPDCQSVRLRGQIHGYRPSGPVQIFPLLRDNVNRTNSWQSYI